MRSGKVILLKPTYNGDSSIIEVGVDEAGRGALAGPVTVAACIMPADFQHELIRDSKLLSEGQRAEARQIVLDNAIAWAVRHVDIADIEYLNILGATLKGMDMTLLEVVKKLSLTLSRLMVISSTGSKEFPLKLSLEVITSISTSPLLLSWLRPKEIC